MPVTAKQVVELLSALVRIESVTPWLIPTGSGEAKVAAFMADWLDRAGAEVEIVEVEPGRPNVLARLRGTGGGPTLCLNAHTDTVGRPAFTDGADGADFARGARAAPDAQVLPGISVVVPSFGIALRGDLTPGFSGPLSASCLSNPSLGPLLTCGPFRTRCSRARSVAALA